MEKINEDFSIPFYIFEEIVQYVEETAQGRCRTMQFENIKALLRLAQVNDRLTDTQVKHIIDTYCREPKRNDIIK
ncbi:MAG: hypothetical protein ACI4U9_03505 [Clostridia bacterium]